MAGQLRALLGAGVAPVMAAYASQVLALYRGGQVRTAFYQYVEGGALAFWAWLLCLRRD
jgi:hypothetical protein